MGNCLLIGIGFGYWVIDYGWVNEFILMRDWKFLIVMIYNKNIIVEWLLLLFNINNYVIFYINFKFVFG